MTETDLTGIHKIVESATKLLEELKEFAPFGLIFKNGEWIDLATYDDSMDSNKMKSFLIETIVKDFDNETTKFGAVCVNATIKEVGDVIMIYNTSNGKDWYELVYKYEMKGNSVDVVMKNIKY